MVLGGARTGRRAEHAGGAALFLRYRVDRPGTAGGAVPRRERSRCWKGRVRVAGAHRSGARPRCSPVGYRLLRESDSAMRRCNLRS